MRSLDDWKEIFLGGIASRISLFSASSCWKVLVYKNYCRIFYMSSESVITERCDGCEWWNKNVGITVCFFFLRMWSAWSLLLTVYNDLVECVVGEWHEAWICYMCCGCVKVWQMYFQSKYFFADVMNSWTQYIANQISLWMKVNAYFVGCRNSERSWTTMAMLYRDCQRSAKTLYL